MEKTKVLLYSNGCPRCKILEHKLNAKEVVFEKTTNFTKLISMGISSVPVLFWKNEYLQFSDAVGVINSL